MKRANSLRLQLLGWLLLPLGLLLLVNAFFSHRTAELTANRAYDSLLIASADTIADQVSLKGGKLSVDLPYVALQLLETDLQERVFYRVVAPDGSTLTGYDDLPMPPKKPRGVGADAQVHYSTQYRGETIYLVAIYKQVYGLETTDPVIILVAETGESRQALSREILIADLERQAVLILASALLVWFGLGWGLKPLMALRDNLLKRSPWDLSPLDPSPVQTEIQPLIAALNQHTARIEKLIEGRQRFIADASHQLRTPLSELRTQVEYTLRQNRAELSHETLRTLQGWIDGQTRLIGQLLMLARSEPEAMQGQPGAKADLAELAREAALEYIAAARRKTIDLSFDGPEQGVFMTGNTLLLHELVANLLDNAIRYTPAHGAITVRAMQDGTSAVLEVEDNGPGIAPAEREKVFERFYRAGQRDTQGSGLGLSIVRDICASHGARIALLDPLEGDQGLRVQICFKLVQTE
ncbi:sensor histidine kinase [Polaromonas sp. OV174]|uniref:sensor histidine kinase n=1 Tax=Polaromonas sp. OV174 TaxID=1855300 RepID=UPI000A5B3A97|nr:sensor histidine kinase [Polaromonas sp. OV174]